MRLSAEDFIIIGDSFCAHRDSPDNWPYVFHLYMTGEYGIPRGEGHAGCAWWSTRFELLKALDIRVPKLAVICHTDAFRMPSKNNYGMNSRSAKMFNGEIEKSLSLYYDHLIDHKFHKWIQKRWFMEVDAIAEEFDIKMIHLHCFDTNDYVFKNGITSTQSLHSICSDRNCDDMHLQNHFTAEENRALAEQLIHVYDNWDRYIGHNNLDLLAKLNCKPRRFYGII